MTDPKPKPRPKSNRRKGTPQPLPPDQHQTPAIHLFLPGEDEPVVLRGVTGPFMNSVDSGYVVRWLEPSDDEPGGEILVTASASHMAMNVGRAWGSEWVIQLYEDPDDLKLGLVVIG